VSTGFDLGSAAATETRNSTTDPTPVTLFNSTSRIGSAPGGKIRIGYFVTSGVSLEAGLLFSRPSVSTRLTGDFEQADSLTAKETLSQYFVDGAVVYHLTALSFAKGRGVPFVTGGGGYLREVHEGNGLIDTGTAYQVGAGLKLWFGNGAHRFGLRGDVGISSRKGGFDFSDGRRTLPTAGASLVYLF
jgi:hypothetical protein